MPGGVNARDPDAILFGEEHLIGSSKF